MGTLPIVQNVEIHVSCAHGDPKRIARATINALLSLAPKSSKNERLEAIARRHRLEWPV